MTLENAGIIAGIAAPVVALLIWAMRAIVAPLGVVIENNTRVMERIEGRIDKHTETLEDHGIRIACIETVHEVESKAG
jgi:hypothetical protein